MHLRLDQPIAVPADRAQAAFVDPAFYAGLDSLGAISAPAVLAFSSDRGRARLELAYSFSGHLNGLATKMLDPAKLSWVQLSDIDLVSRHTDLRMVPDHYSKMLSFSGWYDLVPTSEAACRQHLEADLRVNLPLLGPLAERGIAAGVKQNLAATAKLVESFTAERDGTPLPGGRQAPGSEGRAPGSEGRAPGSEGQAPGSEGRAPGSEGQAP